MKMSLLEMVQDILNDLDSDEVNDLDDTIESQQVAQIIKTCYFEMIANRNWPHTRKLVQLEASGSLARPNYLKLPDALKELVSFSYNVGTVTEPRFVELKYKEPDAFLRYISSRNNSSGNLVVVNDFSGVQLNIFNNTDPQFWTSFDDTYLVTDSYNIDADDTLKKSKTQCIAYLTPVWQRTNESIPDLPAEAFPALLEEAKSTASLALKQMANQKAEQKANRQQRWLSRKAWRAEGGVTYQDFGRKGRR
jgi:hypothetical protein